MNLITFESKTFHLNSEINMWIFKKLFETLHYYLHSENKYLNLKMRSGSANWYFNSKIWNFNYEKIYLNSKILIESEK